MLTCARRDERKCTEPPSGFHTWGMYPDGTHNRQVPLCPACAEDLWEKIKGPVMAGTMHYQVEPYASPREFQ